MLLTSRPGVHRTATAGTSPTRGLGDPGLLQPGAQPESHGGLADAECLAAASTDGQPARGSHRRGLTRSGLDTARSCKHSGPDLHAVATANWQRGSRLQATADNTPSPPGPHLQPEPPFSPPLCCRRLPPSSEGHRRRRKYASCQPTALQRFKRNHPVR